MDIAVIVLCVGTKIRWNFLAIVDLYYMGQKGGGGDRKGSVERPNFCCSSKKTKKISALR